MPNPIVSLLSKALKALADKGENVPINRVEKRLENAGVRRDEIRAAGIPTLLDYSDKVTTRSGNEAITPETIRELDPHRFDKYAVNTNFVTVEEKGRDQYSQLINEEMDNINIEDNFADSQAYLDDIDESVLRERELEQDLAQEMPDDVRIRDFFENVTSQDVDGNDIEILIFKDPRDTTDFFQKSKHFEPMGGIDDVQRNEYSYHARFIEEEKAINVQEMQSDLVGALVDKYPLSPQMDIIGVPNVNVSQNIINRMIGLAVDRDKAEVKFFIGGSNRKIIDDDPTQALIPDNYTYFDEATENGSTLIRSEPIQRHYETVISGQIKRTAEKIGGKVKPDSKGYLILTLPAAGFTLPLYAEEDKENSFIATATMRGNDPEEAREYLNTRQPQSPPPLPEGRSVRGDFNTGGKVLGSLHRNCG